MEVRMNTPRAQIQSHYDTRHTVLTQVHGKSLPLPISPIRTPLALALGARAALPTIAPFQLPSSHTSDGTGSTRIYLFSSLEASKLYNYPVRRNRLRQACPGAARCMLRDAHCLLFVVQNAHPSSGYSRVNFSSSAPNFEHWPRLRGIQAQYVDLEPGNLLYIPAFW